MSLIVCRCFSIGNRLQRKVATCWYCFSIPVNPMLLLLRPSNKASWCYVHQDPVRQFTKFTQFTKCDIPKSSVVRQSTIYNLQSPISSGVPFTNLNCDSTSAPFTKSPLCVATVAPSCSESPLINYYSV